MYNIIKIHTLTFTLLIKPRTQKEGKTLFIYEMRNARQTEKREWQETHKHEVNKILREGWNEGK